MKPDSSDDHRPSEAESIEATAAAWLAELDDGLSPEKQREFAAWRAADSRHDAAVSRLENTWSTLQQLRDFRPAAQRHPDRDLLCASPDVRRRRSPWPALATAGFAAAALAFAAFWWTGLSRETSTQPQRFATTIDGYERVTLPDGSQIELNAASEVSVEFTPAERRVRLVRGEAHFTVARNKERPFAVEAGAVAVRAVGTAFNVRLGARDVEVLVTEGKVEVGDFVPPAPRSASTPAVSTPPSPSRPVRALGVNERALIPTLGAGAAIPDAVVEKVSVDVVHKALAWQGPRLTFANTPLSDAVAQFNRRNLIQLVVADAELETLPIGGSFRPEHVDAFVRLLESDADIAVDRSDPSRVVLRKAR